MIGVAVLIWFFVLVMGVVQTYRNIKMDHEIEDLKRKKNRHIVREGLETASLRARVISWRVVSDLEDMISVAIEMPDGIPDWYLKMPAKATELFKIGSYVRIYFSPEES